MEVGIVHSPGIAEPALRTVWAPGRPRNQSSVGYARTPLVMQAGLLQLRSEEVEECDALVANADSRHSEEGRRADRSIYKPKRGPSLGTESAGTLVLTS